jgi:hypothetical protein
MADDYGNFRASPAFLHTQVFWGINTKREDVAKARETLTRISLVSLYEVGGQSYGHVTGWAKHQRVDHPGKPLCPSQEQGIPITCADSSRGSQESLANLPETLAPDKDGIGKTIRNKERSPAARVECSPAFLEFWKQYPRKVAKGAAIKSWPGDDLLPAITAALSWQTKAWTDPQFIPHPATYLRQRRWEDEKVEPAVSARSNGREQRPVFWRES